MTQIPIRIIPDPVLRRKAKAVTAVDKRVVRLMEDMLETLYKTRGAIGLAGNQVGSLSRVIVVDVSKAHDGRQALLMANPKIISSSRVTKIRRESCLSIPRLRVNVARPQRIRVTYFDQYSQKQDTEARGLLAVCIGHELDHLNGRLITDHTSKPALNVIGRRARLAHPSP
jgi:peptide deformylase